MAVSVTEGDLLVVEFAITNGTIDAGRSVMVELEYISGTAIGKAETACQHAW